MRRLALFLFSFVLPGSLITRAADEAPVALPPFFVEESAKGPPWRYASFEGTEILSRCPDYLTRQVVYAHHRLHRVLAEVLPPNLQVKHTVPRTLLIFPEELQPAASQEVIARMMHTIDAPPVIDTVGPFGRGIRAPGSAPRFTFLPNLRLWDRDATAVFMIARRDGFEAERLALTSNYVHYLVKNRVPMLPAWFISGFLSLFDRAQFDGGDLVLRPLEWVTPSLTEALKADPKKPAPLIPLGEFFAGRLPARENEAAPEPLERWRAQAALLVHWGLDDRGPRREALWKFAERAAVLGTSEPLFRECFGLGFAEAEAQLLAHRAGALKSSERFRAPRETPPRLTPRDATEAEIARIRGDWERMEISYVRALSPSLAPKYIEQARRTLRRAYEHGVRDAGLLNVFGLCELDAGNEEEARKLLEAALARGPLRPRAAFELARMRFAEMQAQSAGQPLDATKAADVFALLFAARAGDPPLAEVYELIADVWLACSATPKRDHLAVLNEGVRLFPRRTPLIRRAADLYRRHGYRDEAIALVTLGLRFAPDESARAGLLALQRELEK